MEPPSQQYSHLQKELWKIQDVLEALSKHKPQRNTVDGMNSYGPMTNFKQRNEVRNPWYHWDIKPCTWFYHRYWLQIIKCEDLRPSCFLEKHNLNGYLLDCCSGKQEIWRSDPKEKLLTKTKSPLLQPRSSLVPGLLSVCRWWAA